MGCGTELAHPSLPRDTEFVDAILGLCFHRYNFVFSELGALEVPV